jgi:hypothetical protein
VTFKAFVLRSQSAVTSLLPVLPSAVENLTFFIAASYKPLPTIKTFVPPDDGP